VTPLREVLGWPRNAVLGAGAIRTRFAYEDYCMDTRFAEQVLREDPPPPPSRLRPPRTSGPCSGKT
jgi:hypothetical protein